MLLSRRLISSLGAYGRASIVGNLSYSRWLTSGKATPTGTKEFIQRSELPMFLQLEKSQLSLGPVIHGSVRDWHSRPEVTDEYIHLLALKAVAENFVNTLVVYEHGETSKEYAIKDINNLLQEAEVKREELVLIANLGRLRGDIDVQARLQRALELTKLETIDLAYFEV